MWKGEGEYEKDEKGRGPVKVIIKRKGEREYRVG
jgi:hypothetical protein